jgi:hypothetical protein
MSERENSVHCLMTPLLFSTLLSVTRATGYDDEDDDPIDPDHLPNRLSPLSLFHQCPLATAHSTHTQCASQLSFIYANDCPY